MLLKSNTYVPADLLILTAAENNKRFIYNYSSIKGESSYAIKCPIRQSDLALYDQEIEDLQ